MGFFVTWNAQSRDVLQWSGGCKHSTVLIISENLCSERNFATELTVPMVILSSFWRQQIIAPLIFSEDKELCQSYRVSLFESGCECQITSALVSPALKTEMLNSTRRTRMAELYNSTWWQDSGLEALPAFPENLFFECLVLQFLPSSNTGHWSDNLTYF